MRVFKTDELTNILDDSNNLLGYIDETGERLFAINLAGYAEEIGTVASIKEAKYKLQNYITSLGVL